MDITIAGKGEYNFYSAIVPEEMAEEVMATYAIHPGVQETEVLRRWTMTPGEGEAQGYTILTAFSGGQGPGKLATRLLRHTLRDFAAHRGMLWGWWQIEYENTGLKHGVECSGVYAHVDKGDEPWSLSRAKRLMQYLADKFSVSVYINGL